MAQHYFFSRDFILKNPWAHRLGQRIEALVIGVIVGCLRLLPLAWAVASARFLFRWIGPLTGTRIKVERNLRVAFPDQSLSERKRLVRAIFGNLGASMAEIAQLDTIRAESATRVEYAEEGDCEFLRRDVPIVFVTAHVGAWTLTNFLPDRYHTPVTIVYAPESNPYIHDLIRYLREALPVRLIPRDNSMRVLMKELGAGRSVGLGSDVRFDGGEMVPFFGREMATNTVPARLALRYDCPLVPIRADRLPGNRFRIVIGCPVEPSDQQADTEAKILDMSAQLNAVFEDWIRATPEHWMCMARRWPKEVERRGE